MTSRPPAQCLSCVHWISPFDRTDPGALSDEPTQICDAFPLADGGIPDAIWWNRADHRKSYPGDHGIQWQSAEGMTFPEYALAPEAR